METIVTVPKLNYSSASSVGKFGRWKTFYIVTVMVTGIKGMYHNYALCKYGAEKCGNIQAIFYFSKLMGCKALTYQNFTFLEIVHRKKATEKFFLGLNGDHLGNVRLTYADSDGNNAIDASTEIIEESNYYPFGLEHKGYNNVVSANSNNVASKFKYNGIEKEEALGLDLYEMPLRQYDPAIGRFTSIDPVLHYSMSTYNAFDNNPVFFADPTGADGEHYNWSTGRYEDADGNEVSFEQALASVGVNSNNSESPDDTYKLCKNGKIEKVDEKKYYDKNGNEVDRLVSEETGETRDVADGILDTVEHKEEGTDWQVFKMTTNTNYTPFKTLYKWIIENSNVEFSLTYFNREGYITTSYTKGSEGGEKELLIDLHGTIPNGITIKSVHNHPSGAAFPSEGDKRYASMFKRLYSENTLRFYVIANGTNKYLNIRFHT